MPIDDSSIAVGCGRLHSRIRSISLTVALGRDSVEENA